MTCGLLQHFYKKLIQDSSPHWIIQLFAQLYTSCRLPCHHVTQLACPVWPSAPGYFTHHWKFCVRSRWQWKKGILMSLNYVNSQAETVPGSHWSQALCFYFQFVAKCTRKYYKRNTCIASSYLNSLPAASVFLPCEFQAEVMSPCKNFSSGNDKCLSHHQHFQ